MSFSQSLRWRRVLLTATVAPLLVVAMVAASLSNAGVAPGKGAKNPATGMAKAMSAAFRDAAKEVQPTVVMIKNEGRCPSSLTAVLRRMTKDHWRKDSASVSPACQTWGSSSSRCPDSPGTHRAAWEAA